LIDLIIINIIGHNADFNWI